MDCDGGYVEMAEFIDINDVQRKYEWAVARLQSDHQISQHSKELMLRFLRDARLGKTNPGRARKAVALSRLTSFLQHLTILSYYVGKDLDAVSQEEMETFIEALDNDVIRSRQQHFASHAVADRPPLSASYKAAVKMTVRKFYKWLLGDSRTFPSLVEWIDTSLESVEVPALTADEIVRLVDHCRSIRDRALVQVLFDGGFRIGELMNVRIEHVTLRRFEEADASQCFVIRIPFSKTQRRTVALPMTATTRLLGAWFQDHPARPVVQQDGTFAAKNLEAPLFPLRVRRVRKILRAAGKAALCKAVWPHLLRHSSATFWANRMPYFRFCKRFGWTMTSKMPQRYIDREGVDELMGAAEFLREQQVTEPVADLPSARTNEVAHPLRAQLDDRHLQPRPRRAVPALPRRPEGLGGHGPAPPPRPRPSHGGPLLPQPAAGQEGFLRGRGARS